MDVDLEVKNSGGEGRFSVRATTHHQHHQQVCLPTTGSSFCVEGDFPGEDNFLTVAFLCDFGHSVVIHTNFESLGIVLLLCLCMMGPDRYNIHVHYVKLTCTLHVMTVYPGTDPGYYSICGYFLDHTVLMY